MVRAHFIIIVALCVLLCSSALLALGAPAVDLIGISATSALQPPLTGANDDVPLTINDSSVRVWLALRHDDLKEIHVSMSYQLDNGIRRQATLKEPKLRHLVTNVSTVVFVDWDAERDLGFHARTGLLNISVSDNTSSTCADVG
jgi:hypothetical protein